MERRSWRAGAIIISQRSGNLHNTNAVAKHVLGAAPKAKASEGKERASTKRWAELREKDQEVYKAELKCVSQNATKEG